MIYIIKKVIKVWLQVYFYSILIPLLLCVCGIIKFGEIDFGLKQQIFLPISYEHYWFATAYVMLYLYRNKEAYNLSRHLY